MKTCMVIIQCQRDKFCTVRLLWAGVLVLSQQVHITQCSNMQPLLRLLFAALIPFTGSSALHGAFLWPLSAIYCPPG